MNTDINVLLWQRAEVNRMIDAMKARYDELTDTVNRIEQSRAADNDGVVAVYARYNEQP